VECQVDRLPTLFAAVMDQGKSLHENWVFRIASMFVPKVFSKKN
jgi:hypothetical protein